MMRRGFSVSAMGRRCRPLSATREGEGCGVGPYARRVRSAGSGPTLVGSVRRGRALRSSGARAAARLLSSSASVGRLACSVATLLARAAAASLLGSSFASPCVLPPRCAALPPPLYSASLAALPPPLYSASLAALPPPRFIASIMPKP